MARSRFEMMKVQAEVLQKLEEVLNQEITNYSCEYTVIGEEPEQATDWRTGELKWEDDEKTIPFFKKIYGYVPLKELDEEATIRVEVCNSFLKKLDKLI